MAHPGTVTVVTPSSPEYFENASETPELVAHENKMETEKIKR